MMLIYERAVTESPDRESTSRADEYTRNFLQGEALPTIFQELAFHRRFLPGITLAEINKLTEDWFPANNRLILVVAPESATVVLPDERQLAAAVRTHPVFCLMKSEVMESLVRFTQAGERKIDRWTARHRVAEVLFDDAAAFANANTPADLQELQRHA